jgi:hypothetical protein
MLLPRQGQFCEDGAIVIFGPHHMGGTTSGEGGSAMSFTVEDSSMIGHKRWFHQGLLAAPDYYSDQMITFKNWTQANNTGTQSRGPWQNGGQTVITPESTKNLTILFSRSVFTRSRCSPDTVMQSKAEGGAIAFGIGFSGDVTFEHSEFSHNNAMRGSAAHFAGVGSASFFSCVFKHNVAFVAGGAISFVMETGLTISNLIVRNSIFSNNAVVAVSNPKVSVCVRMYTGAGKPKRIPIFKIDGAPPLTGCNNRNCSREDPHANNNPWCLSPTGQKSCWCRDKPLAERPLCKDGFVYANETVYGWNWPREANTATMIDLEPGRHTLYMGMHADTHQLLSAWPGNGWISIFGVLDQTFPTIKDNRLYFSANNLVLVVPGFDCDFDPHHVLHSITHYVWRSRYPDSSGYARFPGCFAGTDDYHPFNCPTNETFWTSIEFTVPYGEGGGVYASGNNQIHVVNSTFDGSGRAGKGSAFMSVGTELLSIKSTTFEVGETVELPAVGQVQCGPGACSLGQQCKFRQHSIDCSQPCAINEYGDGYRCIQCPQGMGPVRNDTINRTTGCEHCAADQSSDRGYCRGCPAGQLQSKIVDAENGSVTHCTKCPAGKVIEGIACVSCPPGKQPDRGVACESCNAFGHLHYSDVWSDATYFKCKTCKLGEVANTDATGCQCAAGRYNAADGLVTCVDTNFKTGAFFNQDEYQIAANQYREMQDAHRSLQCINCPDCLTCHGAVNGSEWDVKKGFGLSPKAQTALRLGFLEGDKTFLRCQPDIRDENKELLVAKEATVEDIEDHEKQVVCLGGPIDQGLPCRTGHTGVLCSACIEGWGKKLGPCVPCEQTLDPTELLDVAIMIVLAVLVVGILVIALSFAIGDVYETDAESESPLSQNVSSKDENGNKQFDNPLNEEPQDEEPHDEGTPDPVPRGHKIAEKAIPKVISSHAIMRSSKRLLKSGIAMSTQPMKIFLSYWQIAGHLTSILHFQFPPHLAHLFAFFQPLVSIYLLPLQQLYTDSAVPHELTEN